MSGFHRPHRGSPESARRLFAMAQPISGTVVEAYLRKRGITALHGTGSLRFHPRCYYRPDRHSPTETWPAMIAAVTDLDGKITGAHRTWLDPSGRDKAAIDTPRRAMGNLLGNAVRFDVAHDCLGGRRRHRDHAVASMRHADHADGGRALGRTPRRHPVPSDTAPALHRPRRRSGRGRRHGESDRPGERGRDRGDSPVATTGRLQRGSPHARHRCATGSVAGADRTRKTSLDSWNWRHESARGNDVRGGAGLMPHSVVGASQPCRRGPRPRPSERATLAANGPDRQWRMAGYFPSAGKRRLYIAKQNSRPPPSSAALRPFAPLRVQVRSARRLSSP